MWKRIRQLGEKFRASRSLTTGSHLGGLAEEYPFLRQPSGRVEVAFGQSMGIVDDEYFERQKLSEFRIGGDFGDRAGNHQKLLRRFSYEIIQMSGNIFLLRPCQFLLLASGHEFSNEGGTTSLKSPS